MLMVSGQYYRAVKSAAEQQPFQNVIALTEDQIERQRHMEFAVRFLVHTSVPYDGNLDVEEYIDNGIIQLAKASDGVAAQELLSQTFSLLNGVAGRDTLRRFEDGQYSGKVGLVGLEGIAVGVAKNLHEILALPRPDEYVRTKVNKFWSEPETASFTSPGLRGTTRIQRTIPFGEAWFRP